MTGNRTVHGAVRPELGEGVLSGGRFVPLEELRRRAGRVASAMTAMGLRRGDTVALLLRNDHPFFEISFAAAALGVNPVPINWHDSAADVAYILDDSAAAVLFAHEDLLVPLRGALPARVTVVAVRTPAATLKAYGARPGPEHRPPGEEIYERWRDEAPERDLGRVSSPLSMIYTSGTTGRPKGVRRLAYDETAEQAVAYTRDKFAALGLHPEMRTVITGPMYHSAPNLYALSAARLGGFLVLQDRFDAEGLLRLVEEHRITALHLVPTMFVRLLRLPEEVRASYDVGSLRHVVHAGAPCPPDVKRAIIDWFGPIVHEYYGCTEAGAMVGCDSHEWLGHPGTVGRPFASCTVRILDDDGNDLPPGRVGDIYMRSAGFGDFTYQGRPEERAAAERAGLLTGGDVGYLDADGYLYLCDRKRDMIITGGVNVYPAEIEAAILQLAGVRDCAVFGAPDEEFGESIAAAIEVQPGAVLTESAVRAHVAGTLARFKAPKLVTFHDRLPREDSGKVFKQRLREPYWRDAGRAI
ncbi:acyl-CoA synthetase [Actinomadura roseirufa]|uniref:acyl-CoA synthetase n=1 Tax=Actinomadura roseirufa TaxID=2094049 RepID=UPI0010410E4E|nr:acyl-CoA synthetase [Actinomadura roseirufa]